MGIRLPQSERTDDLLVTFAGVTKCPSAPPYWPDPLNGEVRLPLIAHQIWYLDDGDNVIVAEPDDGQFLLTAKVRYLYLTLTTFIANFNFPLPTAVDNLRQCGEEWYDYGNGQAHIDWFYEGTSAIDDSAEVLLGGFNLAKTFKEPIPLAPSGVVNRYARQFDGSRFYVKFENEQENE